MGLVGVRVPPDENGRLEWTYGGNGRANNRGNTGGNGRGDDEETADGGRGTAEHGNGNTEHRTENDGDTFRPVSPSSPVMR